MSPHDDGGLPVVPAAELDEPDAARRWLIEDLWARAGVGIIGGAPKCCKSWLGLDLAVSVASGTPCLDTFPVAEPGGALVYIARPRLTPQSTTPERDELPSPARAGTGCAYGKGAQTRARPVRSGRRGGRPRRAEAELGRRGSGG